MGYERRIIISQEPYTLCLRAKRGLPFAYLQIVKLLLDSALARTQRDTKVTICHYVWMRNHLHMLLIAHDPAQATKFYMEVQKKITDYFKRLLGRAELTLWEERPSFARVLDIEQAIHEISYYYLNPAQANLIEDIKEYPGLSSWGAYQQCAEQCVGAAVTSPTPWIRQPMIRPLPSLTISQKQDRFLSAKLLEQVKVNHDLTVNPNAWMRCFGITEQLQITAINRQIQDRIIRQHSDLKVTRLRNNIKVVGVNRLITAPISFEHQPKKKSRRIYVLSSDRTARIQYIGFIKRISALCRELYRRARLGELVQWPPGVFIPQLPPKASALGFS